MKLNLQKQIFTFFLVLTFQIFFSSLSNAEENQINNNPTMEQKNLIELIMMGTGIGGGLFGMYKHFSNLREKEIREWQKVIIIKILRQEEQDSLKFETILEKFRSEAQSFDKYNLKKEEFNENTLRRIILELASSNIIIQLQDNRFKLNIFTPKVDKYEMSMKIDKLLNKLVGENRFTYSPEQVAARISEATGAPKDILLADYYNGIKEGYFVLDEHNRMAFPHKG